MIHFMLPYRVLRKTSWMVNDVCKRKKIRLHSEIQFQIDEIQFEQPFAISSAVLILLILFNDVSESASVHS